MGRACVGIAGGLMPSYLAVHPEVGTLFGLIAFVIVAMGGFGSIPGALVAALQCIDLCHLAEYQDALAGDLPIGMKKRLEMARTLATGPRLLMLDEAMAGLTATEVKTAVGLILRIRENGVTLLVVEHIMEAIMPIADKVVVLDGGKKIADGPPNEIIENEQVIKAYFGEKYSKRLKQERKNGQSPAQG